VGGEMDSDQLDIELQKLKNDRFRILVMFATVIIGATLAATVSLQLLRERGSDKIKIEIEKMQDTQRKVLEDQYERIKRLEEQIQILNRIIHHPTLSFC
jgi:predicted RNase H-like nuclease (RuvC/YqgF family)